MAPLITPSPLLPAARRQLLPFSILSDSEVLREGVLLPRMLKLARVERGGGHADFGSDIHLRVWGRVGFEDRGEIKSFQDFEDPFRELEFFG